jgi:hypothetical protein
MAQGFADGEELQWVSKVPLCPRTPQICAFESKCLLTLTIYGATDFSYSQPKQRAHPFVPILPYASEEIPPFSMPTSCPPISDIVKKTAVYKHNAKTLQ